MRILLACGKDPEALGIIDEQGNWNYERFKAHVKRCPECDVFFFALGKVLFDKLKDALGR